MLLAWIVGFMEAAAPLPAVSHGRPAFASPVLA